MPTSIDRGDIKILTGVYLSRQVAHPNYRGTIRLSDLSIFAEVARSSRVDIVLTSLSRDMIDGSEHHRRLGTYDLRTRGQTSAEMSRLVAALDSAGFHVHPEPAAPLGPHLHIEKG